jgi:hypothetical protein
MQISQSEAYGVRVFRSSADITAKVVRVRDGKIMAVFEAEAQAGGESWRGAARDALKEAGKAIGEKLIRKLEQILSPE